VGGLARAAGAARLIEPRWLVGGDAALVVDPAAPALWLFDIDDTATRRRAEAVAPLPGEAALFAARGDAGRRWLRHRLARLMLAGAAGCRPDAVVLGRSAAGAPLVAVPDGWHMSVAARWPACLIGIARERIGVDLEAIDRDLPPETDLLTPDERDRLALTPAEDQPGFFAAAWAAKESHAKWTGFPRAVAPALVDSGDTHVRSPWGDTRCWRRRVGDLVAALCAAG
jgi:hypothetical protein